MTTVDSDAKRADTARDGLLSRHLLFVFFLLSFILTWGYFWLIWTPLRLPDSLIALGGFGPAASAFLVLALTSGKSGVLRLLRSIVHWRVGATWYLVALLGLPVLNFLAFLVVPGVLGDFVAPGLRLPWIYLSEMAISVTVGNCSDVGRNWVARFRPTPHTAPIRSCSRNPHAWSTVGCVAPALLLWALGANRTRGH